MSDLPSYLLVDIGNSRIKYALVSSSPDFIDVMFCQKVDELAPFIQQSAKVIVASVGHVILVQQLQHICQSYQVDCQLVTTQAENFGVYCAYEHFTNLGVDRWLAILAAREITSLPVAVIDLGTATTCDIVIDNQHIGGWIAPGFSLMKSSLLANTQKVFGDSKVPKHLGLGVSTQDCVNMGCLSALQGLVMMAENYLSSRVKEYRIFVTGGDQALVSEIKNANFDNFPNLVLLGLSRFI